MEKTHYSSPIGLLEITGDEKEIFSISFLEKETETIDSGSTTFLLKKCLKQLDDFFEGKRKIFDVALSPEGTSFQQKVWHLLLQIPFGKTLSYTEIANKLGEKKAVRAVGNANSRNPIPIIIPCHRVIGNKGSLTGYAGGLWRKEWLLNHEKKILQKQLILF